MPDRKEYMIRLIAAIDTRRGIATESGIPWTLPGDTAYFHEKTASGLILMGWATYNEFASPLHGRDNFVLTTQPGPLREGFRAATSVGQLRAGHKDEDIWVIGGATVYAETITDADELLLTQVLADYHCTKFFPPYRAQFESICQSAEHQDGNVNYRFEVWRPKQKDRAAARP
jgi:dihydrofolate reductase